MKEKNEKKGIELAPDQLNMYLAFASPLVLFAVALVAAALGWWTS